MQDLARYQAISIRQPWCHFILHDGKDVENRTWPSRFRGPVLIYASKTPDDAAYRRRIGAPWAASSASWRSWTAYPDTKAP